MNIVGRHKSKQDSRAGEIARIGGQGVKTDNPGLWFCGLRAKMRTRTHRRYRRAITGILASAIVTAIPAAPAHAAGHPLTIDDVLDLTSIDRVAPSPDGEWLATVVLRAARPGEVYNRTYYELDPSRADVWLSSRRTGERRNITQGAKAAAGFWCASWSPDGSKLAMLSTRPEGDEPRGGDNVRLYVWDRASGAVTRVSDAAMMTQTRTPLYQLDLRGGADQSMIAHRCHYYENAPFAWLDNHRLLAVMLPAGDVSGLIDEFARPARQAAGAARALHDGIEPTVTAAGSGAERMPRDERANSALLRTIDVDTGIATTISTVPTYPFRGALTLSIAPDGRRIAILATLGTIPPARGQHIPFQDGSWAVEKRLGFVDLSPGAPIRWSAMPPEARYPLELFGWSPDSRKVALRARGGADATATPLFIASADDLSVDRIGPGALSVGGADAGPSWSHEAVAFWIDDRRLLVRAHADAAGAAEAKARADWWLVAPEDNAVNLTMGAPEPPTAFRRSAGRFIAIVGNSLLALDMAGRRLEPVSAAPLPAKAWIAWPRDAGRETSEIVVAADAPDGGRIFQQVPLRGPTGTPRRFTLPHGADLLDFDAMHGSAVSQQGTKKGLFLRETALADGKSRDLLSLDTHLAAVDWGRNLLIDYRSEDGEALKGAVILPPGYQAGRRYPTITWVYAGYRVRDLVDNYWLDPYMPGIYNLQLYAARGYVVLIPSMPLGRDGQKNDTLLDITKGALPAVDRLIDLGIADPARVGVMGQSFGGYSVYSLVTQTRGFKAAIALAGLTDLTADYAMFDPTARGYPGIEHEKSDNWAIVEAGQTGIAVPPYEDYWRYWRNSPLAYVDRVETPLLLIQGEYDIRGSMTQAESFFFSLYRQGKTARLLRYWGENHGLALSPANVRNIFDESVRWFDKYLRDRPGQAGIPDSAKAAPAG